MPLPPPPDPMLIKCNYGNGEGSPRRGRPACNRWVWSHSRTPLALFVDDRAFCAEHVPGTTLEREGRWGEEID